MKKKLSGIIWGVFLIVAGILLALNALDVFNFDVFFDGWWTLFIIIPCTVGAITERDKISNIVGIFVGVGLLLACQDVFNFELIWKLFVPVLVLALGVRMIFKNVKNNKAAGRIEEIEENGEDIRSANAVFGGVNLRPDHEEFHGAELNAVFGGVECDLRNAVIEKDCVIKATAIFGGIDIFLPSNVNVEISSNSLFGGVSDKKKQNKEENTVTVYIQGCAVFGGVDVK